MSTIAVLLFEASVSSEGVSISDSMVMGLTRRFLPEGLFDLADFITAAGGVFIPLGFNGFVEGFLQLAQSLMQGLPREGALRHFARVGHTLVHVFEHALNRRGKGFVAMRA